MCVTGLAQKLGLPTPPPPASQHTLPLPCGFPKALRSVTGGTRTPGSPAPHCRADLPGYAARDWPLAERAPIGRRPPGLRVGALPPLRRPVPSLRYSSPGEGRQARCGDDRRGHLLGWRGEGGGRPGTSDRSFLRPSKQPALRC